MGDSFGVILIYCRHD